MVMGETIHFTILKYGNTARWDSNVRALNKRYKDIIETRTEPMRTIRAIKDGWIFTKTYGIQPFHNAVKRMIAASAKYGFAVEIYDGLTGEKYVIGEGNLRRRRPPVGKTRRRRRRPRRRQPRRATGGFRLGQGLLR